MALSLRALRAVTSVYLALPIVIFAYGWLRPSFASLTILLVTIFMAGALRDTFHAARPGWRRLQTRQSSWIQSIAWMIPAGLLLVASLLLSGAGGLGFQTPDYRASNALLKELILEDWPLTFVLDGVPTRLVYYVAYYLPAAAIGRALGWLAANDVIWVWTLIGFGLAFAWFQRLSRVELKRRAGRLLWLALIFCLAGGLDYVATYVLEHAASNLTVHIETWAGYFQYSSNTTLIYWVPQHAIAAWLMVSLVVDSLYHVHDLRYLGMSLAAGILWSPFGLIGVVPYLLLLPGVYWSPARRRYLCQSATLLANAAALWVGGVLGLYVISNRYDFPAGWIWQAVDNPARLIRFLFAFWWVEFAGLALLLLLFLGLGLLLPQSTSPSQPSPPPLRRWYACLKQRFDIEPQQFRLFIVSLVVLTLLPVLRVGIVNDLVMRASIPSLFILWMFTAKVVVDADNRTLARQVPLRVSLVYLLLVIVVMVGFLPGIAEVARSIRFYRFGPPPLEEIHSMADANEEIVVKQRAGDGDSVFFRYIGR